MTSFQIREEFFRFFKEKKHTSLPSSSLIPQNDPSLLFVNAGMNQFKSVFLGESPPPAPQVVTIQKCLRAGGKHNDLENVGETPWHNTFFEMMGNFSFGSYFKEEAIGLAWEFLTKNLGFSEESLYASVFKEDREAYSIWKEVIGLPEHKIFSFGEKDNFWRMGASGPCGPCSEIHYYEGEKKYPSPEDLTEIWNLVFMEFFEKENGERTPLPKLCIDTGMGLERLTTLVQRQESNYNTDLFREIIATLEKFSGKHYNFKKGFYGNSSESFEEGKAFRVVADHCRAAAFLITDGALPGNEGRNYVLRRILRRAFYYSHKLNPKVNLLQKGTETLISLMKGVYPELERETELIHSLIEAEEKQFSDSLSLGRKILFKKEKWTDIHELKTLHLYKEIHINPNRKVQLCKELSKDKDFVKGDISENSIKLKLKNLDFLSTGKGLKNVSKRNKEIFDKYKSFSIEELQDEIESLKDKNYLDSQLVWDLYSTHGFPFDLTRLMAKEKGFKVNLEEAEKIKAKESAKQSQNQTSEREFSVKDQVRQKAVRYHSQMDVFCATEFTGYKKQEDRGEILSLWSFDEPSESLLIPSDVLEMGQSGFVITDRTCFYPEGGGPVGDRGEMRAETGVAKVKDCQKISQIIFHEVEVTKGKLKTGQKIYLIVDKNHRQDIATSHSGTHLLHYALRKVLGPSARQAGSLVEPGRLRFDFTSPAPLTSRQLNEVEDIVNHIVKEKKKVTSQEMSYRKAVGEGVIFLQGENYDEKVRVISMGDSKELCGGIHVFNTGEIKTFRIASETGVQSGVRRITAYTGSRGERWGTLLKNQMEELENYLQQICDSKKTDSKKKLKKENFPRSSKSSSYRFNKTEAPFETVNPFIEWIKQQKEWIKFFEKQLQKFNISKTVSPPKEPSFVILEKKLSSRDNLALRKFLKLPPPKEDEKNNPLLEVFKKEWERGANLKKQWESSLSTSSIDRTKLVKKAKAFKGKSCLLVLELPFKDSKQLASFTDQLKNEISSGLVVAMGEGTSQFPLVVTVTKDLQEVISAGGLLKQTIAPFVKGRGGGQPRFAQGIATDREAFSKLEEVLLEELKRLSV